MGNICERCVDPPTYNKQNLSTGINISSSRNFISTVSELLFCLLNNNRIQSATVFITSASNSRGCKKCAPAAGACLQLLTYTSATRQRNKSRLPDQQSSLMTFRRQNLFASRDPQQQEDKKQQLARRLVCTMFVI